MVSEYRTRSVLVKGVKFGPVVIYTPEHKLELKDPSGRC